MTSWTAFYWGDYLRDTLDLDLEAHGAYIRLLAHYYSVGGPLPTEPSGLYRICGAASKSEKKAVDFVVRRFFHRTPDGYSHGRADAEIAKREEIRQQRSEAGKRSGASRRKTGKVTSFPGSGR